MDLLILLKSTLISKLEPVKSKCVWMLCVCVLCVCAVVCMSCGVYMCMQCGVHAVCVCLPQSVCYELGCSYHNPLDL